MGTEKFIPYPFGMGLVYFIITSSFLFLAFSFSGKGSLADMSKADGKIDAWKVYRNNCQKCHGEDGRKTTRGKALGAPDFTDANWQASISDGEIVTAITNGKNKMPSQKGELDAKEILAVVKVVRSFAKKKKK